MYTAFFGLREKPFALSPDPRFLFLSAAHREALAHLLYGIEQGEGFIAVTGEVGTGKTTLCRTLLRRLGGEVEVAFLFNPKLSARELLEAILVELGVAKRGESTRELVDELNHFLLERRQQGKRVLIIIDEAQGLAPDTLEQIRLLSNLETETDKLIQILLLGQPELDALLESEELRQLRQRIGVRWRLAPLSREETGEYIRHRLRVSAGADRDHVFPDATVREIFRRSGGVPRVVNLLCDRSLLAAYAEGSPQVDAPSVARAADETGAGVRSGAGSAGSGARRGVALAAAAGLLGAVLAGGFWLASRPAGDLAPTPAAALDTALPEVPAPIEAAATPAVSAPPPVEAESQPIAVPAVAATPASVETAALATAVATPEAAPPVEASNTPPAPPHIEDLARALALRAPGITASESLASLLQAWSIASAEPVPDLLSFEELLDALATHGLGVVPLAGADLERLRAIDHPALLVLPASDGVPRVVSLRRLDGDAAELLGVVERGPALVGQDELLRLWSGDAYVVWREFEALPELLRAGDAGQAVSWLQRSLAELGFSTGPPSGVFDATTELAVRAFQADRQLEPDGAVGPLTKMSLYRALGRYGSPEVASHGDAG